MGNSNGREAKQGGDWLPQAWLAGCRAAPGGSGDRCRFGVVLERRTIRSRPSKTPPLPVTIQTRTTDVTKFTGDELTLAYLTEIVRSGKAEAPFTLQVDTGAYRALAIYQIKQPDKPIDPMPTIRA